VPSHITVTLLHNAMKKLGLEVWPVEDNAERQVPHRRISPQQGEPAELVEPDEGYR
jgi:hypothetical protein